jgi:hypothetical protein
MHRQINDEVRRITVNIANAPIIAEVQAAGATSLRAIAAGLNDRGDPDRTGQRDLVGGFKWRA